MNNYKFGNYICSLREQRGLTQAELAERIEVTDKAVSKWDQSLQENKVMLYEDDECGKYLWLVENHSETIFSEEEEDGYKEYEDFDEHYVYYFKDTE